MHLQYTSPKNIPHVSIQEKQNWFYLSSLASIFKKKSKKTNQTNPPLKLRKITNFPITNKINLPDKAKVPEKNLVEIPRE